MSTMTTFIYGHIVNKNNANNFIVQIFHSFQVFNRADSALNLRDSRCFVDEGKLVLIKCQNICN